MNGLTEHLGLLKQIERYFNIAVSTSITGLQLLDASETKGRVHIKFDCPDRHFPEYGFSVEFRVSRDFFEKNLKKMLEIDV